MSQSSHTVCSIHTNTQTYAQTHAHTNKPPPMVHLANFIRYSFKKRHTRQLAVRPETAYKQQKRKGKRREGGCFSRKGKEGECGREEGKAGVSSTD